MFGLGFGEILVILIVILLFFGSDKIPEMARGFAKGMAQIKNATNEIKSEITKSVDDSGVIKDIKETINVNDIKNRIGYNEIQDSLKTDMFSPVSDIQKEIDNAKEDIDNLTGPIKRNN